MIRFALKCVNDHSFESWFASGAAFERLLASGHVTCPECGAAKVEKALMAPALSKVVKGNLEKPLTAPQDPREQAVAELRKQIEENSEYVGMSFSAEARAMHEGRAPERAIYGEAKLDEAKSLIEDGIPVLPLPFSTRRNTN